LLGGCPFEKIKTTTQRRAKVEVGTTQTVEHLGQIGVYISINLTQGRGGSANVQ
jgi:hypothetical protein